MLNHWDLVGPMFYNAGLQHSYGFQNAPAACAPDIMATRLEAAKFALHSPERVERLANGRGWRLKPTDAQIDLALLMQQYHPKRPPKGHDHPDWI